MCGKKCRIALAVALMTAVIATDARGQQAQTGAIVGTVTDASGGALAGVTMTATSAQLIGGPQRAETDSAGRFRLTAIPPGVYGLVAERAGFQRTLRVGIDLTPGFTATIDVQLAIAPVAEAVVVDAAPPVVDVRSSASPALIGRQLLEHLPLARFVLGYVNLAPGVTVNVAFGGSSGANPISVDGTSGNNPGWGDPIAQPHPLWMEAVQMTSVGAAAEYGEYTGASINAITKSGSNRFSGLGQYWTTRPNWTSKNRGSLPPNLAQRFKPLQVLERWEAVAQMGGPLAQDRLWFFGGVDYFTDAWRPSSFSAGPRTSDEPRALNRETKVLAKLTAGLTSGFRIEGYVNHNAGSTVNGNAGPLVRPEALTMSRYPQWIHNARLTWTVDSRTLFEAGYGGFNSHSTSGPTPPTSPLGPPWHRDQLTGVQSGNAASFSDNDRRTFNGRAAVTRYLDPSGGSHELKVGIDYEHARIVDRSGWPGGAQYLDFNGAPDLALFWAGATYRGAHHRTSFFAQDRWTIDNRVTLEPGVRIGIYRGAVPIPDATPYDNSSISPRLGAAWDVSPDHRTVVRAHYGRYHDPMVSSFYDLLDPLSQAPTIMARVLGPGLLEELSNDHAEVAGITIDPHAKHSYAQEYVAGVERELVSRLSVRVQYIRRSFKDSLGYIDTGSTWTPVTVIDPGQDGLVGTGGDDAPILLYENRRLDQRYRILTNPAAAWRSYDGVQVIGNRRYAGGWELQASYTWARSRGSYDNEFSSNTGNNDLGDNGNFVNPNRALYSGTRSVMDRRHDVKVLGTYLAPYWGGVRVSGVYRYVSGQPYARVLAINRLTPFTNLCCTFVEPVGTRQLPASSNDTDLRVEKTFDMRSTTTVAVYLDLFNITNRGVALNVERSGGPNFELPAAWQSPRILRAGVRMSF